MNRLIQALNVIAHILCTWIIFGYTGPILLSDSAASCIVLGMVFVIGWYIYLIGVFNGIYLKYFDKLPR